MAMYRWKDWEDRVKHTPKSLYGTKKRSSSIPRAGVTIEDDDNSVQPVWQKKFHQGLPSKAPTTASYARDEESGKTVPVRKRKPKDTKEAKWADE